MHPSNIVILTGAGISAESGLSTFRDGNGLWCNHRIEDVATPEAFAHNPALVHEFYNLRRAQLKEVQPNAAHLALAELACRWPGKFLLVTQNVDNLHERALGGKLPAGGFHLLHMYGELTRIRCERCDEVREWHDPLSAATSCPACNNRNYLRPHIVWFGEMPIGMEHIERALAECDLFVSIGTSGNVYPAAGFVQQARMHGARCVELNLERTVGSDIFHESVQGNASDVVPRFIIQLFKGNSVRSL